MILLRNKTYSFIGNSIRAAGGFLFGSILGSIPTYILTGSKKASLIAGAIMGTWVARNEIKLAQEAKAEEEMGKQELEQIKAKNKNWGNDVPKDYQKFALLCSTKQFLCPFNPTYTEPWERAYDKKQGFYTGLGVYLYADKPKGASRQPLMYAHYKNNTWEYTLDEEGKKKIEGKEKSLKSVLNIFLKKFYKIYGIDSKYNREDIKKSIKAIQNL